MRSPRHPAIAAFVMPAKAGISGYGAAQTDAMRGDYTYIMTNKPRGVVYVGVTADLLARAFQHRQGGGSAFCRSYNLHRLALAEEHATIEEAICREKANLFEAGDSPPETPAFAGVTGEAEPAQ